jgi:hypothetical protein
VVEHELEMLAIARWHQGGGAFGEAVFHGGNGQRSLPAIGLHQDLG